MFYFVAPTSDVYRNLATEEYLLKYRSENIFMLWQSKNAVVVGKNQNIHAEVNTTYTIKHGIDIARRYSGGGTVYQDMGNINLTFIENRAQVTFDRYVRRVTAFLSSLGINAQADHRLSITVNGLKVSGSAQCIYKHRVMYHCTLLFASDLNKLHNSLAIQTRETEIVSETPDVRAVKSVPSQVTNLCYYLPAELSVAQFKELVLNYFLIANPANNRYYPLSLENHAAIEELRNGKYARAEWISGKAQKLFA